MKRALTIIIIIVVALAAIEAGLQLINLAVHLQDKENKMPDERCLLSYYQSKEWATTYWKEFIESANWEWEPFLGWDRREYHGQYINIDSHGVRKNWNPEPTGDRNRKTLYIFGGSTAWGTGARDDYTIPSYLSKMLNNDGYNITVYNYGETAYTFTQGIIHLTLLLREGHRPDYVVFYDGFNDVYGAYQSGTPGALHNLSLFREKLKRKEPTPLQHIALGLKGFFTQHCMIYRAINGATTGIRTLFSPQHQFEEAASTYDDNKLKALSQGIVNNYIASTKLLDNLSQIYGFKYMCLWHPSAYTEGKLTDEERKAAGKRLNDKALSSLLIETNNLLGAKSIPHFINISDALSDRAQSVYIDDVHLSEVGNETIAAKIVSLLRSKLLTQ